MQDLTPNRGHGMERVEGGRVLALEDDVLGGEEGVERGRGLGGGRGEEG